MTTVELRKPPTAGEIRDRLQEVDDAAAVEQVRPIRRPQALRPRMGFGMGLLLRASLTLSALVLGFVVYLLLLAPLQQSRTQDVLYAQLRETLALATTPIEGVIEPGTPVAVLRVDSIGLDQVVVEGTASGDLQAGPGHRRNTALPGQQGVSLVYGRSTTYGAPFGLVTRLQPGEEMTVVTGQGQFTYTVAGIRRDGDPLPTALAEGGSRLTLVTSENAGGDGRLAAGTTVYVDAVLTGGDAQAAGQRPGLIPPYEQAMKNDPGALVPVVLWLQALVVASALTTWGRRQWGRWQTWIVAVPTVVLVTWQLYGAAARLLPNLL